MRLNSTTLEVPQRLQGSDIRHPLRDVTHLWLAAVGRGLCQFWHQDRRVLNLHGSGNPTGKPVLNALSTALLFHIEQLCDFRWAAKASYQLGVMQVCSHTRY